MKAILSNKIYMDRPNDKLAAEIEKTLTYKIVPSKPQTFKINGKTITKVETIRAFSRVSASVLAIPIGRTELIPEDYEVVDKRINLPVEWPEPLIPLNQFQKPIVDQITDSCMVNAGVGWGKTFSALHMAKNLGRKTLVIVHTLALLEQWVLECEKMFGIKPGLITAKEKNIEGHFLVITNIQTFNKVKDTYAKEFGLVLTDEAHHCQATTFTETLTAMHARYYIGLSATLTRLDGKHVLFNNVFGDIVYTPEQSNVMTPRVEVLKTNIMLNMSLPHVSRINELLYSTDYQDFISGITLVKLKEGHKVLVIADRVEFLENVYANIGDTAVLITGATKERESLLDLVRSGEKSAVVASRSIFSEGISLNQLSCVILASPSGNLSILTQVIGRIMRIAEDKLQPLVVDVQFADRGSRINNTARMGFYLEQGWQIDYV